MSAASQLLLDQVARQNRAVCNRLTREERDKLMVQAVVTIDPAAFKLSEEDKAAAQRWSKTVWMAIKQRKNPWADMERMRK